MGFDPVGGFHGAAAIARAGSWWLARPSGNHLNKSVGKQRTGFFQADIAAAVRGGLRQLAEYHQFGERRRRADLPDLGPVADLVQQFRTQEERQALVAADVFVRADIFVTGMADQDASRHQFEEAAAALAAEAALAHIRDGVAAMPLDERRVVRASAAAELGNRNGIALQKSGCNHGRNFTPAGASEQLEAAPRTRSY